MPAAVEARVIAVHADFFERDVQPWGTCHDDVEVVGEEGDLFDHLVDQDAAPVLGGFLPDRPGCPAKPAGLRPLRESPNRLSSWAACTAPVSKPAVDGFKKRLGDGVHGDAVVDEQDDACLVAREVEHHGDVAEAAASVAVVLEMVEVG